jgi:hypothetical protein
MSIIIAQNMQTNTFTPVSVGGSKSVYTDVSAPISSPALITVASEKKNNRQSSVIYFDRAVSQNMGAPLDVCSPADVCQYRAQIKFAFPLTGCSNQEIELRTLREQLITLISDDEAFSKLLKGVTDLSGSYLHA